MFGFRDIDIIRAIVRHGGFRAASDAIGLAQSAISRRVRHLEDRMKVTIFERDGRGVRLTAAGRRLVEETDVLVAQRDRILSELTQGVMAGVVQAWGGRNHDPHDPAKDADRPAQPAPTAAL